jgi:hypothetical protein
MTESLKTLLHRQATSVDFKPSDLEAIVGTSHARVRRRRALATLATIVAVALAGGGVAAVVGNPTDGPPPPLPASPWPLDAVSWATGSTIHVGATDTIEVGHEVNAYVRTATGFVVLDGTDAVYSVTEHGVTRIGQMHDTLPNNTDVQRLVVNSSGTLVGWVDESALPDKLAVRIYDPVYGSTRDIPAPRTTPDIHALPGVLLFAIGDHTAYWRTYEGVHEFDLDSGSDRLIVAREDVQPGDAIYSYEVYSAENGVLAFTPEDDRRIFAGRSVEDAIELVDFREYKSQIQIPEELQAQGAEIIEGHTDPVRLSPTGDWLSFGIFEAIAVPVGNPADGGADVSEQRIRPVVFNTATGERVTLAIPDTMLGMPSVWLDDTTLQVLAFTVDMQQPEAPTSVSLYACSLPDATCRLRVQIEPPIPQFGAFPDGRWYGHR